MEMNIFRGIRRVAIPVAAIAIALLALNQPGKNCFAAQRATNHSRTRWKVYENSAFGFSITCPSGWKVDGGEKGNPLVIICPHNPKPHEFYITIGTESKSLDAVRAQFAEFTKRSPSSKFIERGVVFAGGKAYQFTRTDNPGYYAVYVPHGGRMYLVSAAQFDLPMVRRAVKTFRFVGHKG